ncbi:MAG: hypothetical protein ACR2GL_02840 [Thermoleophilaceae bacterium]
MVVALISLFVALGGSAYALTVTGRDVKNGSLTGVDVRNGSITGRDVRKNGLTGRHIRENRLGKVRRARVADKVGDRTVSEVTTRAFFGAQKAPKGFTGTDTLIGTISLPAGTFVISAKVTASNSSTGTLRATCYLRAGASEDQGTVGLPPGNGANTGVIPLLQAHFQSSPFTASVFCKAEGNPGLNLFNNPPFTTATNTKIAAIRADDADVLDF